MAFEFIDENQLQDAYLKAAQNAEPTGTKEAIKWRDQGLKNGTVRSGTGYCPGGEYTRTNG